MRFQKERYLHEIKNQFKLESKVEQDRLIHLTNTHDLIILRPTRRSNSQLETPFHALSSRPRKLIQPLPQLSQQRDVIHRLLLVRGVFEVDIQSVEAVILDEGD